MTAQKIDELCLSWYFSPIGNKAERTEKGKKMTRKDYELLANAIALINKQFTEEIDNAKNTDQEKHFILGAVRGIQLVTNSIASSLSTDNSRFQGVRFLEACGVDRDRYFLIFSNSTEKENA